MKTHTVTFTSDEAREVRKAIEREIARQRFNCGDVGMSESVYHLAMASALLIESDEPIVTNNDTSEAAYNRAKLNNEIDDELSRQRSELLHHRHEADTD